jgi:hypothetical protein
MTRKRLLERPRVLRGRGAQLVAARSRTGASDRPRRSQGDEALAPEKTERGRIPDDRDDARINELRAESHRTLAVLSRYLGYPESWADELERQSYARGRVWKIPG